MRPEFRRDEFGPLVKGCGWSDTSELGRLTIAIYCGKTGYTLSEAYTPAWVSKLRLVEKYPGVDSKDFGVDFTKHIWRSRAQTLMQAEYHADELVEDDRKRKEKNQPKH